MFILKMILKLLLLPVYLIVCFVKTWVDLLAKLGCIMLGLFYLLMLCIFIMLICQHQWVQLGIATAFSFAAFLASLLLVAAGTALDVIGDRIGDLIAG